MDFLDFLQTGLSGIRNLDLNIHYGHRRFGLTQPSIVLTPWRDRTENFITEVIKLQAQGFKIELWGYSMGGRLALHALAHSPQLFHKAKILSSNPGLESQSEKELRLQRDLNWSQKFLTQEWNSLMFDWNQQPVLREPNNSLSLVQRNEIDYDRLRLAKSLDHWSIGRQKNFWEFIPILIYPD